MSARRWYRPVAVGIAIVALLSVGSQLRSQLGISLSAEGIRAWVGELGALGPLVYLALFASRQALALPAILLIPTAGLCFGVVGGTAVATAGLVVNAILVFLSARWGFRGRRQARDPQEGGLVQRLESTGPWLLGSIVAHPAGPLTPAFVASGMSSMPLVAFSGVTLTAGLVRCLLWAFVGSTLVDFGSPRSLLASGLLASALLLPILYRAARSGGTEQDTARAPLERTPLQERRDREC